MMDTEAGISGRIEIWAGAGKVERLLGGIDREVIDAAVRLGTSRVASLARVMSVISLYYGAEKIYATKEEPIEACRGMLRGLIASLNFAAECGFPPGHFGSLADADATLAKILVDDPPVEKVTGAHYGALFGSFSAHSYWEEPRELLGVRLRRNEIETASLPGQHILDAGCGGGRYTVAWRLLGAGRVTGVDISPTNIATAQRRMDEAGIDGVAFAEGNVLALPFPDGTFDGVFSNGVLHHTPDWKTGIGELLRVLKPGGWGWLYLIESPGGLYWELIEIMREIMQTEDRGFARSLLRMLEVPENRIFYMLDHVLAPINIRMSPEEIEECLTDNGATEIRRLTRGADFDRIERIYRGEPYATSKYGVGENRFIFKRGDNR